MALLRRLADGTPPIPETIAAPIRPVLERSLARSPAERCQTPAELIELLDHALAQLAAPVSTVPGIGQQAPDPAERSGGEAAQPASRTRPRRTG